MRFCIKSDALRDPALQNAMGPTPTLVWTKSEPSWHDSPPFRTRSCCNSATWALNLRISSSGSSTSICCGRRLLCGGSDTLLAASSLNRSRLTNACCNCVFSRPNLASIDLWINFNVESNLSPTGNTRHWSCAFFNASLSGWASGLPSPNTFNAASRRSTLARASAARSYGLSRGWGAATLARPCGARGPVGCLGGVRPRWPPVFLDEVVARLGLAPRCHAPGGGLGPLRIVLHMPCDKLSSNTHFLFLLIVCRDLQTAQQHNKTWHTPHKQEVSRTRNGLSQNGYIDTKNQLADIFHQKGILHVMSEIIC